LGGAHQLEAPGSSPTERYSKTSRGITGKETFKKPSQILIAHFGLRTKTEEREPYGMAPPRDIL
jgi:hypothetical protein